MLRIALTALLGAILTLTLPGWANAQHAGADEGLFEIGVTHDGDNYILALSPGEAPIRVDAKTAAAVAVALAKVLDGDWKPFPVLGKSCESYCKKCKPDERAQCGANCLSGYGPQCTPVPRVGGFHWPTCHDSWPDCVPPFALKQSPAAAARTPPPAHCDCPVCCKYWFDPTVYLHCVTVHCGGPQ